MLVSPGTYYENIDFKGKTITVISSAGPVATIIDGGAKASTVTFKTGETRASVLSGFTIRNGGQPVYFLSAAGIYISAAAPSIIGNVITRNYCYDLYASVSAPLIQNNEISFTLDAGDKCSFAGGAGMWLQGNLSSYGLPPGTPVYPTIIGNTIEQNTDSGTEDAGGNGGAGIADWNAYPIIENNIIRNNTTADGTGGGGINIVSGGALVIQNLIYGNQAGCGSGGLAFDFGTDEGPGSIETRTASPRFRPARSRRAPTTSAPAIEEAPPISRRQPP